MVECSPATRAARVRFPADATFFYFVSYNSAWKILEMYFNTAAAYTLYFYHYYYWCLFAFTSGVVGCEVVFEKNVQS